MKLDLIYTENRTNEKPERIGKCFNFNTGEKLDGGRRRKHFTTAAWGKRYFCHQKCVPPSGIRIKAASTAEIREQQRINCCAKCQ